jgi:hypothetical protein
MQHCVRFRNVLDKSTMTTRLQEARLLWVRYTDKRTNAGFDRQQLIASGHAHAVGCTVTQTFYFFRGALQSNPPGRQLLSSSFRYFHACILLPSRSSRILSVIEVASTFLLPYRYRGRTPSHRHGPLPCSATPLHRTTRGRKRRSPM